MHGRVKVPPAFASVLLVAACNGSSTVHESTGGTIAVCGVTISRLAATPLLVDLTRPGATQTVRATAGDGLLYFRTSESCDRGAKIMWSPSSDASLVRRALAKDGLPAAVVIRPHSRQSALTVTVIHSGGLPAVAHVDLSR